MLTLLALAAFGIVTGMVAGLLGVGGGIFMVPFLVLAVGLSQQEAQATSLLVILPTAIVASWLLHRRGVGDLRAALRIGVVGMLGGVAGTVLALSLSGTVLRVIFAGLVAVVGLRLLRDAARPAPDAQS